MKCPECGFDKAKPKLWPFHCRCGAVLNAAGNIVSHDTTRTIPLRTDAELTAIANVCLACPNIRDHHLVGLRCTHRNCNCGQGEQETVELANHVWNGGLVNRMRRGKCPDGRW